MADSTNISVVGQEAYFNQDAKFFQDVYIYGTLYYEFEAKTKEIFDDIEVKGTATFLGNVNIDANLYSKFITADFLTVNTSSTFNGSLDAQNINVGIATVTQLFDVGAGGATIRASSATGKVGIGVTNPIQTLDVIGNVYVQDRIGIGSTNPEQKLDVSGSVKINSQIYDSSNNPGDLGSFLTKDAQGIRWTTFEPSFTEGIFVYNDGVLIGINSYRGINFKTGRGAGINTDPVQAFQNPSTSNIADISVYDYWDFVDGTTNIYRNSYVGINNSNPSVALDVTGDVKISSSLDVSGNVEFKSSTSSTTKDTGALVLTSGGLGVEENVNVGGNISGQGTLTIGGLTQINNALNVTGIASISNTTQSTTKDNGSLVVKGGAGISGNLNLGNNLVVNENITGQSTLTIAGSTQLNNTLSVTGVTTISSTAQSTTKDDGALIVEGGVGIEKNLNVGQNTRINGTLKLDSSLIDVNSSSATGKFDYRLSSVGTGVSWRPPGVQTQNAIWVTMDGNDSNTGYLEGDAKRTIGAAAAIAQEGDTIFIRSGVYYENNPIGLRTDVSVSGQDLRLVTIIPSNPTKDVFHVRRGCLIENLNFAGSSISVNHPNCGALAFPPTNPADFANTGYIAPGPATEGPTGRWRSPYVRNCTNFMTGSIGMKINGDHATASTIGNDLKCMVCDSFTQYNENGIGVSITNNGYAQLVSIFTINCDIGIYCDSGGSCDLTNSNSSFGNYGLVAVGVGSTEFVGSVATYPPTRTQSGVDAGSDIVTFSNMRDNLGVGSIRRPYDGQSLFFKINLDNYPDTEGTGILQAPMLQVQEIIVTNGGSGYSAASPPTVIIRDANDLTQQPKGPQGIIAEVSPTVDEVTGSITSIDVTNSGRNYLPTQQLEVFIDGSGGATATVITQPIYYTVDTATDPAAVTGITTVTFNEFIPYELFGGEQVDLRRISRILTSSHSFEYIGTGTSINTATPFQGAVPIKANEVVALNGAQVPFTSTDQKGNFDIGEGFQINQPTATIRGRDFSKAIQAELTPLILALR